jgi:hypothetical protein
MQGTRFSEAGHLQQLRSMMLVRQRHRAAHHLRPLLVHFGLSERVPGCTRVGDACLHWGLAGVLHPTRVVVG